MQRILVFSISSFNVENEWTRALMPYGKYDFLYPFTFWYWFLVSSKLDGSGFISTSYLIVFVNSTFLVDESICSSSSRDEVHSPSGRVDSFA